MSSFVNLSDGIYVMDMFGEDSYRAMKNVKCNNCLVTNKQTIWVNDYEEQYEWPSVGWRSVGSFVSGKCHCLQDKRHIATHDTRKTPTHSFAPV